MSTPLDRVPGPDDPSPYAPKWARERAPRPDAESTADVDLFGGGSGPAEPPVPRDQPGAAAPFRLPRSLDPTILVELPPAAPRRAWLGPVSLGVVAIMAAAVVAAFVVGWLPPSATATAEHTSGSFLSRFAELTAGTGQKSTIVPQLVAAQSPSRVGDEAVPLGMTVKGAGKSTSVMLTGLPTGATLSSGQAVGANAWQLSAAELDRAMLRLPSGVVGTVDVLVELRQHDGTVVERRALRFERAAPPKPEPARQAIRQLDADELAMLIRRGEDFIASGDLAAARLVLQRAAEAGDARAALALAGTYDPNVLDQLGARGFAPDVAMAQAWYEKAKAFGSAEAPRRLERLASRDR